VYAWADGIHFNVRPRDPGNNRQCIMVLMGATPDGKKQQIATADGYRESYQSWKELLLVCRSLGLVQRGGDPMPAIGDGTLGFWKAMREVGHSTAEQRCWGRETSNILNKMSKGVHGRAKSMIHDIWMAQKRADTLKAFYLFVETFKAQYSKTVKCLKGDRNVLMKFYDFPAKHWAQPPHDRTDRVDVLHSAIADRQDEGLRVTDGVPDDGVQACAVRRKTLAGVEQFIAHKGSEKRPSDGLPHTQDLTMPFRYVAEE
jgi:transposase-like protein